MIRAVLLLLLVVSAATLLGLAVAEHSGYVLALPQIPRPDKKTKAAANANADGEASADDTQTDTPAWRDSLSTPKLEAEERLITLECQQAARWGRDTQAFATPHQASSASIAATAAGIFVASAPPP